MLTLSSNKPWSVTAWAMVASYMGHSVWRSARDVKADFLASDRWRRTWRSHGCWRVCMGPVPGERLALQKTPNSCSKTASHAVGCFYIMQTCPDQFVAEI